MSVGNMIKHLKTVHTHRKWVKHYCFKAGLYWQGLIHDLSKYSPIEFWESVKYYQGTRSPIDACKEANGYSNAWLHHRGRNKHHREYWTDYYDKGTYAMLMPYKYAAEMLCDFLAAGRAYGGKDFKYYDEWIWWINQLKRNICIHPAIAKFITRTLYNLAYSSNKDKVFSNLPIYYSDAVNWYAWKYSNKVGYSKRSLDFIEELGINDLRLDKP